MKKEKPEWEKRYDKGLQKLVKRSGIGWGLVLPAVFINVYAKRFIRRMIKEKVISLTK
jgi:hypothetical protein